MPSSQQKPVTVPHVELTTLLHCRPQLQSWWLKATQLLLTAPAPADVQFNPVIARAAATALASLLVPKGDINSCAHN
jgi:hypothetical protein